MSVYKYLLIAILALSPCYLLSQITCNPLFQNYYGGDPNADDEAIAVTYCKGGGMIVCGRTTSYSAGQYDGFLLKLTDDGKPVWTRILGGAGNDKLIQVRQTQDGGFVALGESQSFDNTRGETWVLKTDGNGSVQWSKRYSLSAANLEKPRDIIELKGGGYCLVLNSNQGSTTNNAVIVKIDNAGAVNWVSVLDHGKDDGVNHVAEYKDTLLVAGYASGNDKDAVITKLRTIDGALLSAETFFIRAASDEEAFSIEAVQDDIAFGVYTSTLDGNYLTGSRLDYFKRTTGGSILFHRITNVNWSALRWVESLITRSTDDKGFITLANDTMSRGEPVSLKVGPYGQLEWGRAFPISNKGARTTGMDITLDKGYVFAGYTNQYFLNADRKNKIHVFKTNRVGKTGDCPIPLSGESINGADQTINPFQWKNVTLVNVKQSEARMVTNDQTFGIITSCSQLVCDTVQVLEDNCSNSFFAEYKTDQKFVSSDVAKFSDGSYAMAGRYGYTFNQEPTIVKVNKNGSADWIKTYQELDRHAQFVRVVPTTGNAMYAVGTADFKRGGSIIDSAIALKIGTNGAVIWSKKYAAGSGTAFEDIRAASDGGFFVTGALSYSGNGGTLIARLDSNGNFLWRKELHFNSTTTRGILLDGKALYSYGETKFYTPVNGLKSQISIVKLDAGTGDLIWQKQLRSTLVTESVFPQSLSVSGDSLLAAVVIDLPLTMFQSRTQAGVIKLSTQTGSLISAFRLENLQYVLPYQESSYHDGWSGMSGNDILFASKVVSNSDTSLNITRVTSWGTVVWSKKYTGLKQHAVYAFKHVDDGILLTGNKWVGMQEWNQRDTYSFILKTNEKGEVVDKPSSLTCMTSPVAVQLGPLPLIESNKELIRIVTQPENNLSGSVKSSDYSPDTREVQKGSKVFCSKVASCNTFSITGPDSICAITMPVQYRLSRNPGCDIAAIWAIDTAYARILAFSDTTISLQFLKPGNVALSASVTSGCTLISSKMNIQVSSSLNYLNLGSDTVLCVNTSITLHAGNGYRQYLWSHDGSTDSVARISTPGIYSVKVSDYCGNNFSDTIIVMKAAFPFSAGADQTKCGTDTITLSATAGYSNYSWQPRYNIDASSSPNAKVYPGEDTEYIVQAEPVSGCILRDTVHVTVKPRLPLSLGNDTMICYGQPYTLYAAGEFASYRWSNGDIQQKINISSAGTYTIDAISRDNCHSYDTINVSVIPLPVVRLNKDTGICIGSSMTLDAGSHTAYKWQDGSTGKNYTISKPGIYYVQVTDQHGCKQSDTTSILRLYSLPLNFLPADTSICSYNTFIVAATRSYQSYQWNTNEKSRSIRISKSGKYWLQVKDEHNCIGSDSLLVNVNECKLGLFVPTAFTPNGDGKNDHLLAMLFGNVSRFEFWVYNRFGQFVFYSSEPSKSWDGRIKGIPQDAGAYVWICKYQLQNGPQVIKKGITMLVK